MKTKSSYISPLLNPQQAADYLHLSVGTMRNYRLKPGLGPDFIKMKRKVFYSLKDLEKFIKQHGRVKSFTGDEGTET